MGKEGADGGLYLGRRYDLASGGVTDQPVFYEPRHLTTHAIILG